MFLYIDPALVVQIDPTTLTVLDVPPYNLISIVCNVTQPQLVNISKQISWEQTSYSETVEILNHNGIDTNITSVGVGSSSSASILSLYATLEGRWQYTCNASIQVPGDPTISSSQAAEVLVKGIHV